VTGGSTDDDPSGGGVAQAWPLEGHFCQPAPRSRAAGCAASVSWMCFDTGAHLAISGSLRGVHDFWS
jgi:hypothetical protein